MDDNLDILQECARAYQQLMNYKYLLKIELSKKITDHTIIFTKNEFKHLAGIDKLNDLHRYKEMPSEKFFDKVLAGEITFKDLAVSDHIHSQINNYSPNNIRYNLKDRMTELVLLKDYLSNASLSNCSVYEWKRDVHPSQRPNKSDISASFLIVFSGKSSSKVESEKTCAFFIENLKDTARGMSIFPTDISYSDDGKRSVREYRILSLTEVNITTNQTNAIIQVSMDSLNKAIEEANEKEQSNILKKDMRNLKSLRRNHFEKPDSVSCASKYNKRLAAFENQRFYTNEILQIILHQLDDQYRDAHNEDVQQLIKQEIEFIQEILKSRQTQSQQTLVEESSPKIMNFQAPPISGISSGGAAVLTQAPDFATLFYPIINLWERIKSTMKFLFYSPESIDTHNSDISSIDTPKDLQKQAGVSEEKHVISRMTSALNGDHQSDEPFPYYKTRATDQEIAALEQAGISIQRCKKGKESDGKTAIRFDAAHKEQVKMILDGLCAAKQKR